MSVVRELWKKEPARVVSVLAALLVFVAAKVGLVVREQDVLSALLIVLPILLGGEVTRASVAPVAALAVSPRAIPVDEVSAP